MLQWARANGCPWYRDTCEKAARGGHLGVLQWARENGCPWNYRTCSQAARVGHLEVLGREQLMWMLSMRVGVVVLVLRDVEALELHVLLCARGGTLDSRLPPGERIWFCSLVEPPCLHFEDLEQELSHSKQGVHLLFDVSTSFLRSRRDLMLEGEPEGVCVGYQLLHS